MRAKTVNEDLNFERGMDPKKSMGIGVLYGTQDFSSPLEFSQFIFDHLEQITGFKPSNKIANTGGVGSAFYAGDRFWEKLKTYFLKCPHTIKGKHVNDSINMTDWNDININLKRILLSLKN